MRGKNGNSGYELLSSVQFFLVTYEARHAIVEEQWLRSLICKIVTEKSYLY